MHFHCIQLQPLTLNYFQMDSWCITHCFLPKLHEKSGFDENTLGSSSIKKQLCTHTYLYLAKSLYFINRDFLKSGDFPALSDSVTAACGPQAT